MKDEELKSGTEGRGVSDLNCLLGGSCYDCGLKYGSAWWIEAIIPDKVWNKIKPEGCEDGCGILCISCIAKRLTVAGYKNIPIWLCGTEPFDVRIGDTSEELQTLREWEAT